MVWYRPCIASVVGMLVVGGVAFLYWAWGPQPGDWMGMGRSYILSPVGKARMNLFFYGFLSVFSVSLICRMARQGLVRGAPQATSQILSGAGWQPLAALDLNRHECALVSLRIDTGGPVEIALARADEVVGEQRVEPQTSPRRVAPRSRSVTALLAAPSPGRWCIVARRPVDGASRVRIRALPVLQVWPWLREQISGARAT